MIPIPSLARPAATKDPLQQTNPVEYWDARDIKGISEGGNVTSWTGKNGNIATVAAAQAINAGYGNAFYSSGGICGNPSVHCTGSSMLATAANLLSGNYANFSVAMVLWPKSTSYGGQSTINGLGSFANSILTTGIQLQTSQNPEFNMQHFPLGGIGAKGRISAGTVSGSARPLVAIWTYDGSKTFQSVNGLAILWIDGVCVSGQSTGTTTIPMDGPVQIGNLDAGNGFVVDVGAFAFWNRTLEPTEIRKLSAYLHDSFVKDYRPRCFVTGDSIGEGTAQDAGGTIVDQLQKAMPQVRFINAAYGGRTLATQVAGAPPYDNQLNCLQSGDGLLVFTGSIDVATGASAATVEGNQATWVSKAKAQGAFVVQATMVPKQADTDTTTQNAADTQRAALNLSLNTPSNSGADATVDLTTISGFGTNTAWQDTTKYRTISGGFTGANATGGSQSISVQFFPLRKARVASVIKVSDSSDVSSNFESIISSDGHLLQTGGNLAGVALTLTVNDGSHVTSVGTATWVTPIVTVLKPFFGF